MKNTQKKNSILELIIKILNSLGINATEQNLTVSHIKSFLQAKYRRFLLNSKFIAILEKHNLSEYFGLPKYKQEQIIYRISILEDHPQGQICLKNNECPCKCVTSEVILSDSSCDQGCFSEMLDELEWNKFKEERHINVDLVNQKIIKYVS